MLATLLFAPLAHASSEGDEEEFNAMHHSADANYLDFKPFGLVELPRIFLSRRADGSLGLDVYGSTASAVRSGSYRVDMSEAHGGSTSGEEAETDHAPVADTSAGHDEAGNLNTLIEEDEHLEATLVPTGGGHILVDLSITKHLTFALLAAFLVAGIFIGLARRYKRGIGRKTAPKGVYQNMMETVIVFIRDEIARPSLGQHYRPYLPYLLSIFFFILVCNLLGLIPFGATATSNITVTAVLALFTFVVTQFNASSDHWKEVLGADAPWWLRPIMIPIEIIGLFTKPFALAVRLFANMTAGHLVILSLIGLIFTFTNIFGPEAGVGVGFVSVAFSLFIFVLEILVAFIQAYVFAILSALFIGMAIQEHEGEAELMDEADPPSESMQYDEERDATPSAINDRGDGVQSNAQVRSSEPAPA